MSRPWVEPRDSRADLDSASYRVAVPLTLRLYTDFVCPFCFIAEEGTVPRLLLEYDLTLDWNGFELHPGTPRGGLPLTKLFRGANLPAMHERTRRFAAQFGVTHFETPDILQNTRRALAIAELARERGKLDEFRRATFDAHWRQAKNLEADGDLREIAESVGLDPDQAIAASDDPAYLALVDAKQADARANGVSGIPTFIIGNRTIVGCQPFEVVADAAVNAGAVLRARV
jgi:predicted DsbA family dithiol-disulfide isomerase